MGSLVPFWQCITCVPPQVALGEELNHFRRLAQIDPDEVSPLDVHKACILSEKCRDVQQARDMFALFAVRMSTHPRTVALLDEGVLRELLGIMRKEPDNAKTQSCCIVTMNNAIQHNSHLVEAFVAQDGLGPVSAAMDRFPTIALIVAPACDIMRALADCGLGKAVRAAGGVRLLEAACENNPTDASVMESATRALNCLGENPAAASKTVEFHRVMAAADGGETPPTAADIQRLASLSRESRYER